MDKETYETYEYLEADSGDNDTSEFFVVQDDGTFLSVNRPIQYVSQVESVKENLEGTEPCAVYDVTPQQFYVDVDDSSELISVSDQFIMPDGESNLYSNSFLLQTAANSKEGHIEEMEQDEVEETKEIDEKNTQIEADNVKSNGDCTEITLSDEQYQLLERKGWILLEINDKVFLLDTLGLHDITTDEKLIQKLKCEIEDESNEDIQQNTIKVENSNYEGIETKSEMTEADDNNDDETIHFIVEGDQIIADENSQEITEYSENDNQEMLQVETIEGEQDEPIRLEHDYVQLNSVKDTRAKKDNDVLRIKTKFSFKDIPSEIVLGKTITGKKLVARVVKTEAPVDPKQANLKLSQKNGQQQCTTTLEEFKFEHLVQQALRGYDTCSVKDISAAETVVEQLLRVPEFKPAVIERRLMVTKVLILQDTSGNVFKEGRATLVTGRAVQEGARGWRFMFLPTMLPRMLGEEEDDEDEIQDRSEDLDDIFLHIHIRETKGSDGITRMSITLNKRHIPINTMIEMKSRYPKTVFACSACAAVYKTEEGLRLHQETECMETEHSLTIDTDNTNELYSVISSVKEKQYVCNQCHYVFNKLSNCQKHIKQHYKQEPDGNSRNEGQKKTEGAYKCKMCPSTYHHAATLSKHIVSKHIKIRAK